MPPRIAIPMPHSTDHEYSARAIPQYERAVVIAGGQPVRISFDLATAQVQSLIESCDGMLLPGSKADIDPTRFGQEKSPHTAPADLRREETDDLLLGYAYAERKPVLGICYGLQSLNVFRQGSLIQHIPDFLPQETRMMVNHEAGRKVAVAHSVTIESNSKLAQMIRGENGTGAPFLFVSKNQPQRTGRSTKESDENRKGHGLSVADQARQEGGALALGDRLIVPVNSSHHQSADIIGDGLRLAARCPDDGIIEALEGTSPDHFVMAVQWHPERSVDDDEFSQRLFRALIETAR